MFNVLFVFQQRVLEPIRGRDAKSVMLIQSFGGNYEGLRFEVDRLSYLLETSYRQVLAELLIEEERFHAAIRVVNERSNLHLLEIQPLLERAGIVEGGEYSESDFKAVLGPRLFPAIQRVTNDVFSHVDKSVISLLEVSKRLHSALSKLYPDAKFIRFEPDKTALTKGD